MFGKINTKSLEIKNEPNVMSVKSVKSGNIAKVALSIHGTLKIIAKVNAHIRWFTKNKKGKFMRKFIKKIVGIFTIIGIYLVKFANKI